MVSAWYVQLHEDKELLTFHTDGIPTRLSLNRAGKGRQGGNGSKRNLDHGSVLLFIELDGWDATTRKLCVNGGRLDLSQ